MMNASSGPGITFPLTIGQRLLAMVVIFILALGAILAFTHTAVKTLELDVVVLDVAGRQRMMIQRHLNEMLLASHGIQTDFQQTQQALLHSADALQNGGDVVVNLYTDERRSIPAASTARIEQLLEQQRSLLERFFAKTRTLLLEDPDHFPSPESVALLNQLHQELQRNADTVFKLFSAHSRQNIVNLLRSEPVIGFLVIFLSVILARQVVSASRRLEREIEQRKKAEDARKSYEEELANKTRELAQSNAELQQFAYVASHDLQEPLRMVASYTQLLGKRYRGKLDKDADEFIGYAVDGATRMQRLIRDLLEYSRVGSENKSLEHTDSEVVLRQVLDNLSASVRERHAEVTHDPLPIVHANPTHLTQVFQNLIGNALKFQGDSPAKIHVGAKAVPDGWEFSIRDNGVGIPADQLGRIFSIFQRLHGQSEYPGTGIGLAICKRIVEKYGGNIRVESELGTGSIFYFTLTTPRDVMKPVPQTAGSPDLLQSPGEGPENPVT